MTMGTPERVTINTDIIALLMQHETYHERLLNGEFLPDSDTFDELLANEQFRPLINTIGLEGVFDLTHFVHELVIQVLHDQEQHDPQEVAGVKAGFMKLVEWGMVAAMQGEL